MSDLNRTVAAQLWDALSVSVDRFAAKVVKHEKSTFLGYADVSIDATSVLPGFKLKLRGIGVKILKGNPYLDMPSEKGADGTYYPRFFPLSGELREVLTVACFKHEQIDAAMEHAASLPDPGQEADASCAVGVSDDNPFK